MERKRNYTEIHLSKEEMKLTKVTWSDEQIYIVDGIPQNLDKNFSSLYICFCSYCVTLWSVLVLCCNCSIFIPIETAFCDYELTSDSQYGDYTWNESIAGEVISVECATERGSGSMVVRKCFGGSLGWNIIDFSACRRCELKQLLFGYMDLQFLF